MFSLKVKQIIWIYWQTFQVINFLAENKQIFIFFLNDVLSWCWCSFFVDSDAYERMQEKHRKEFDSKLYTNLNYMEIEQNKEYDILDAELEVSYK